MTAQPSLAFRGTLILPGELVPDGVVLVAGERIVAVGRHAGELPAGTAVIDAGDGYISPGIEFGATVGRQA